MMRWPGYRHFSDARSRTTDQPMRLTIVHEVTPKAATLLAAGPRVD